MKMLRNYPFKTIPNKVKRHHNHAIVFNDTYSIKSNLILQLELVYDGIKLFNNGRY